jgi:hypothetical protein
MNKNIEYFRHLHAIAEQIVDAGVADADLAAALKSATMELVSRYDDPAAMFETIYASDTLLGSDLRKAVAIIDGDDDDAGDRSDENTGLLDHPIVRLAQLLVANGHKTSIQSALHYLMHTSHGAALLHRTGTHKGETMRTTETLEDILKDLGPTSLCKAIVDRGRAPCDEGELVAALTKYASEQHPEKSPAQAFAELYKTESVWRACAIAHAAPLVADLAPLQVGGTAAQALDDPAEAIEQLKELGRRKWPSASEAQAFANAMTDPKNSAIAQRAHRRPSPTTSFAFPR